MFITMQLLVIFGARWTKHGPWMLSGTGGSGCKSKDILPILTSGNYRGSHDQIIEDVNLHFSCWISQVASTEGRKRTGPDTTRRDLWQVKSKTQNLVGPLPYTPL